MPPAGSMSGGRYLITTKSRVKDANAHGKTEKSFRGRNDQWFAEIALDLAAEKMKILCRGRRKGDMHVHVCARRGRFKVVVRELMVMTRSQW
jgi:hypothetical protein